MIGTILALLTAVFSSIHDSCINHSSKKSDAYVTALSMTIFSFPVIAIVLLFTGIPEVNRYFWIAVLAKTPLMSLAAIFRTKAHQRADQSLIVPMSCFTPVFVMILGPIFLNQSIKPLGVLGVTILVAGVYVLMIKERHRGLLEPFKALYRNAGVRYMLLVAFIWGITTIFDGIGVINAGGTKGDLFSAFRAGAYWLLWTQICSSIPIVAILLHKRSLRRENFNFKVLMPIGLSSGLEGLAQMCAMGMIPAVYVNSIKRLSIIFTILTGHFYFKEVELRERLTGAIVMIFGFILILLSR